MKEKSTNQKIAHAIRLIKRGWCKRTNARNKSGVPIELGSDKAVKFCLAGACYRAGLGSSFVSELREFLPEKNRGFSITAYNDDVCKNRQQPIAVLQRAIEANRKKK